MIAAALLRRSVRVAGSAPPPPPPPLTPVITSIAPLNGVPGDTITVRYANFTGPTAVQFGIGASATPTIVNSTTLTVVIPLGANTGTLRITHPGGTVTSSTTFTLGASVFDGPATIRRARSVTWEQEAYGAIPDFAAIPGGRRVTVSGSAFSDLVTAVETAAALTGGPRLVIVPDNFRATGRMMPPNNADLAHPIHIAWSRVVDGTYAIARGVRVPETPHPNAPLLETRQEGVSRLGPVISWATTLSDGFADGGAQSQYRFWGMHIRVAETCPVGFTCNVLIYHGWGLDSPTPQGTPEQQPFGNAFSHCWIGGRAFRPDGTWYQSNLMRCFYDGGRSFAFVDSANIEHGSNGGSDQGLYSSTVGMGPVLIRNISTDFGGGICFLNGGSDAAYLPGGALWPNNDDHEISHSLIRRDEKYHPTAGQVDSAGNRCQWIQKNQYETKIGGYWRCHRNVFLNHWTQGQESAVILKAVNQGGNGRFDCTYDTAFTENTIICRPQPEVGVAFAVNGLEFYGGTTSGGTINLLRGMRRLQVRGNVFVGARAGAPGLGDSNGSCMRIGMGAPLLGQEAGGDWSLVENLLDTHPATVIPANPLLKTAFPTNSILGSFVYSRNIHQGFDDDSWGSGAVGTDDTGGMTFGLNGAFDNRMMIDGSGSLTVVDNAFRRTTGVQPPLWWNARGAAQRYYASSAAMGLSRTGVNTLDVAYTYEVGAPLLTAAAGGNRIGPDLALLNSIRAAVVSRDIRGVL